MGNPLLRRNNGREEEEHRPRNPDRGGKKGVGWPYNMSDQVDIPHSRSAHEDDTVASTSPGPYATASMVVEHPTPTPLITSMVGPVQAMPTISPEVVSIGGGDSSNWTIDRGPGKKIIIAAAATSSMMVLVLIGIIALFYRKRKRQRQQTLRSQMQQLKNREGPSMPVHTRTSTIYPQYAPPNLTPPPPLVTSQPVILGPIAPGSNGAYYTGIDTSDIMSVHDRAGLGNPFADGDSLNEEPPPPYRPRSLGPMSRNTSLRTPPAAASRTNATEGNYQSVRSPFADPLDDDAISDMSGPTMRGSHDRMSVVSDLSYQEDPIVTRPAV